MSTAKIILIAAFVLALALGLLAVATPYDPLEVQKQAQLSWDFPDLEAGVWEQYCARLAASEELTESEKHHYLALEERFGAERNGNRGLDNQGGPDGFSYFFMDNVAPDTATFSWIELRGDSGATWMRGSDFTSADDGYSRQKVYIGFPFPFYGVEYDCVRVCANGFLNFTNTTATLSNVCLPASAVNAPIIAMLWDDLHLARGGRADTIVVGYKNFGNYFVIEFDQVGFYSSSCPNVPLSFQAILYNNGNIKLQYNSLPIPAPCANSQTIGIQQAGTAGSPALNYVCNTTGIPPTQGLAIWFFRPNGIPRPCTNLTANLAGSNVVLAWTDPAQDTQGNPIVLDNVQVWLGAAGSGILLAEVPSGAQTYTHVNAPTGNLTYSVRPYRNPFFGTPISVPITVGTPSYNNDFNTNGGLWQPTPATGGWEWGIPWGVPNLVPHSPPSLWGTVVAGNYADNACWQLDFDQGYAVISPAATVEFWHWFYTQSAYDGCNFKVSADNGATWQIVTPTVGGYNTAALNTTNVCMAGQPAWSGLTPRIWQYCVIPLGQYLGQVLKLRFEFGSTPSTNYSGFYFDDMQMWGMQPQAGIPTACTNLQAQVVSGNVVLTWMDPSLDTQGNPVTIDSVQVWLGNPGTGVLLGSVGAGEQTFTHQNPPSGVLRYTVRPYRAPFFGAPASVEITVGNPTYVNNFNLDNGGWVPTPATGGWSWGAPTNPSAPSPHSTPNYWGTGLTANYGNSTCWQVDLNLGLAITSPTATVEFWYRYDTELTYDGCNFKISVDNGNTWSVLTPSQGAYTVAAINTANTCMAGQPAWSGHGQTSWEYAVFPIGNYLGQAPIFRLEFSSDPSVSNYMGFFFDDMVIWGLALPQSANVSGTVTLDGLGGTITNVNVLANGLGNPQTNPAPNGTYTLTGVQIGDRILTASLPGYHTDTITVTVPAGGLTNQDFVLRRVNPPAPAGLTGTVNSLDGVVVLDWTDSPDAQVDAYRIYRRLRGQPWSYRSTVFGRTNSQTTDTLTVGGIYGYYVTAVDTNVIPPAVESSPSNNVEVAYGALPPQNLTADTAYDDRIRLTWLDPLATPGAELFYDEGENTIEGLGFRHANAVLTAGWFASKFQVSQPVQVTQVRAFFTSAAEWGAAMEIGVFPVRADGTPEVQGGTTTSATISAVEDWQDIWLNAPVLVGSGEFFVAIRAACAQPLGLGADATSAFRNQTFYYCATEERGWHPLESVGIAAVPMLRCVFSTNPPHNQAEVMARINGSVLMPKADGFGLTVQKDPWEAIIGKNARTLSAKPDEDRIPFDIPTVREGLRFHDLRLHEPIPYRVEHPAAMAPYFLERGRNGSALDELVRYIIYRNNQVRDSVAGTVLTYTDVVGSNNENVSYSYRITARYDDNSESQPSNTVAARCGMPPGAPTNLTLTPVGSNQMRIMWTDPTVNADNTACTDLAGLRVYRGTQLLATVNPGVGQYTDTPPNPMERYTWSVRGFDEVPREGPAASGTGAVQSPWRTVPYEWVDISQNGINTGLSGDDANAGPFDLGFSFPFYGGDYNSIRICTNGWLSFTSTVTTYTNTAIPATAEPNCALYPFWDDLYVESGTGWIKYLSDAANNRFIVTFYVRRLGGTQYFAFQAILYSNGGIRFNYQSVDVVNSCTIGVENCTGTAAEQLNFNGTGDFTPAAETAVAFWGGPNSFVEGTVRRISQNTPIQNCQVWAVGQPDTASTDSLGQYSLALAPGTYSLVFHHPHHCDSIAQNVVVEDNTVTNVNAVLRYPLIQFSATSLNIVCVEQSSDTATLVISNNGGWCPLSFTITDTAQWLSASPASGTIARNQSQEIQVVVSSGSLPPGSQREAALIVAYNAAGTPTSIPVFMFVVVNSVDRLDGGIPSEFAYHGNYPNPFNPVTELRFDIAQPGHVVLAIYNIMGQEVARPVNDRLAAGRYQVSWSAGDLPSGLYLVRMTAGEFSAVGKLMLLK